MDVFFVFVLFLCLCLLCRDKNSFVQWDMRRAAMKLHTRSQSPKEGEQEDKGVAFSDWKPSRYSNQGCELADDRSPTAFIFAGEVCPLVACW